MIDQDFLKWLRLVSVIEGISTLILFGVAMPLKYAADMPMAVTIVGSVHGLLFISLVVLFMIGRTAVPLSSGLTTAGIVGAVVPFGPFVVDRKLGQLSRGATPRS